MNDPIPIPLKGRPVRALCLIMQAAACLISMGGIGRKAGQSSLLRQARPLFKGAKTIDFHVAL